METTEEKMKTIGEKLTAIRKSKGLTQEVLSDRAGINLRTRLS